MKNGDLNFNRYDFIIVIINLYKIKKYFNEKKNILKGF